MTARFITLEGGEGSGKTTNIPVVRELIENADHPVLVTREPGGTELGEHIRQLLLHDPTTTPIVPDAELLLMFAARQQHIDEVVRPALAAGRWVLCDRFTDATYAYQGGGRGVKRERIALLERWVQGDLRPHRTLLFDLPAQQGLQRAAGRSDPDRFEQEGLAFAQRVRDAYLTAAAAEPTRFCIVDARGSREAVAATLEKALADLL